MNFRFEAILLMTLAILASCSKDHFKNFVAYEAKQRLNAQLQEDLYHLLPFRIHNEPQHFLQMPSFDEVMSAEVAVHWINQDSSLDFPTFNLTEKVRIIIEEESISSVNQKSVMTREFLTQTGFKINMMAGKRYRWRI